MLPMQKTRVHPLDTASVRVLLGTIVAAVFIFIPSVSVPFVATKTFLLAAGAIATLALYILARLTRGNIIIPASLLFCVLWLPVIAYVLAATFSGVPFSTAFWGTGLQPDTLGFMLTTAVLGMLTALVIRRPDQFRSFFRVAAWVFGLLAIAEVLIAVIGQFSSVVPPNFSIVGSYKDLADLLGLGVVAALIAFRFLDLSTTARRALLMSGLAALFLLAIADSIVVWVLLALVSLGLFVETVMRRGKSAGADLDLDEVSVVDEAPTESSDAETRSPVLPLVVLVAALFFLIGGSLGNLLANTLHISTFDIRPSWQSTLTVAQKTYATSPVFGSGPSTFGTQWLKYRDASLNTTQFWNIDFTSGIGFIPTSFVTTGIVGFIAWIGFLALLLVFGVRMLVMRASEDPFMRYVSVVSFVSTIYLFALALFDLPSTVTLALAFVFAGVFISSMRFAKNGRQIGIVFSRSPRLGFIIVFGLTLVLLSSVGALYLLIGQYVATMQVTKASAALSAGDLITAEQSVQNALAFAPVVGAYQVEAGVARAQLDQIAASSTMDKTTAQKAYQTALSAGINAALTATNIDPSDYQNWLTLGNLYAQAVPLKVKGSYDSAKSAYDKAQALNPTSPQIPYILAQLSIANSDTKTAEVDLKQAISLKQDYTDAIFLLSQLEVKDGNIKDALTSALSAAYFTPNNPNILFQVGVLYAAQKDYANAVTALSSAVAVSPDFANARYLLAAVYEKQGNTASALDQLKAIAALSADNAKAIAPQIADLSKGKNPFPANLLSASSTPVK